jgi:hypothetical protein
MQGKDKMNKVFIFFICFLVISCNGNKIIVERTAQELILEFESDWRNANKFYKGKRIEVSGIFVFVNSGMVMNLGEIPIGSRESFSNYVDNNMLIEGEFKYREHFYHLYFNEIIIVQGDYDEFFNKGDSKSIILRNCILISRSVWIQDPDYWANNDNNWSFGIDADISLFEVGNDISYLGLDYYSEGDFIVNNNFFPYFLVHSEGITFSVAFDKNNVVRAVFLGNYPILPSELFRTPEGISVGMSYSEVLELIPNIKLERIVFEGYNKTTLPVYEGYEATLPSGWKIKFMTCSLKDKIIMIYKN